MDISYRKIQLDILDFVRREAPFSAELNSLETANKDIGVLMEHQLSMRDAMPFYVLKDSAYQAAQSSCGGLYVAMKDALAKAFANQELLRFFDCEFLRKHRDIFIPYAAASLKRGDEGLYGRFDFAFCNTTNQVKGLFEFNGDTPVMLFESVNMQDAYTRDVANPECQGNDWYRLMQNRCLPTGSWAVACDTRFVDDLFTCETLCQGIYASTGVTPAFIDIKDIEFNHARISQPFEVIGYSLYNIFLLMPWEEMVDGSPEVFAHWHRWFDNVRFYEPPWRWFLSNKGIMALVTYLLDTDDSFRANYGHLPWLRTTWTKPDYDHVKKPIYGRLSQNIQVVIDGQTDEESDGCYPHTNSVYQEYCPLDRINDSYFIGCMWMCGDKPASIAFREFDSKISILSNERWIPHLLIPDS